MNPPAAQDSGTITSTRPAPPSPQTRPMPTQTTFSELDYAAKKKLTRRDRFLAEIEAVTPWRELVAVIEPHDPKGSRECSPHVESRKAGHVEDYAWRAAANAWTAPEVQAHRQEQERKRQMQRGRDRDGPGLSR